MPPPTAYMKKAASTWAGEWYKYGGGASPWNTIVYDPKYNLILTGTGNGAPYNPYIRSEGKGANLFVASIVALDADTGKYAWHYQENPLEAWDYDATRADHVGDRPFRRRRSRRSDAYSQERLFLHGRSQDREAAGGGQVAARD